MAPRSQTNSRRRSSSTMIISKLPERLHRKECLRMPSLPLVGLPSDTYESNGLLFHSLGDKYVRAIADVAKCLPVMIPSIGDALEFEALLDRLDGIVMTGATSNVHPPH